MSKAIRIHQVGGPEQLRWEEVDVPAPGAVEGRDTLTLGKFLGDVVKLNQDQSNFRIFGPDETLSNRLQAVFEVTNRQWEGRTKDNDEFLHEILFANAPGLECELDVFWAAYAGVDVITYMKKYENRLPLLHLKELGADKTNVDIGKGILDFPNIINTARKLGTKSFIVEQEEYEINSMVSAKNNIEYLAKF